MDKPSKIVLETAVQRFGKRSQIIKTIEECAELQKALSKYLLAMDRPGEIDVYLVENVVEELADVSIMTKQMVHIYGHLNFYRKRQEKVDKLDTLLNMSSKGGMDGNKC